MPRKQKEKTYTMNEFKRDFVPFMLYKLMEPVEEEFQKRIDYLCHKQSTVKRRRIESILYRENVYRRSNGTENGAISTLASEFWPEMDAAIAARQGSMPMERVRLENHLRNVLTCCGTPSDLLVLLPVACHYLFKDDIQESLDHPVTVKSSDVLYSKYPSAQEDEKLIKQRLLLNLLM